MQPAMKTIFAISAHAILGAESVHLRTPQPQQHEAALAESSQITWHKQDCGKHMHKKVKSGEEKSEFVIKDGFFKIDCFKDIMYYYGDTTGDNKDQYKIGARLNTSIVLYDVETPKEDQVGVTPAMCFDFCRSKPGMGFFGLIHGRECYCMPFPEMEASDSSQCDAVCDGDKSSMCGGMTKSTIYEMHVCGGEVVKKRMDKAVAEAEEVGGQLLELAGSAKENAEGLQAAAEEYQAIFGQVGDPAASDLFQFAKESAGKLVHAGEEAAALAETMDAMVEEATGLGEELDDKGVVAAGPLTVKLNEFAASATKEVKKLSPLYDMMVPAANGTKGGVNASSQYMPIHWFLHSEHKSHESSHLDMATTCSGSLVGEAIYGKDLNGCAAACDAAVGECVGFTWVTDICFLLSDFKSAKYYTKCTGLQHPDAKCMAKLQHFEGSNLRPDPSGKCKNCLKELDGANRCFAEPEPEVMKIEAKGAAAAVFALDPDFKFPLDGEHAVCITEDLVNYVNRLPAGGCGNDAAQDIVIEFENKGSSPKKAKLNTCHEKTDYDTTIAVYNAEGFVACNDDRGERDIVDLHSPIVTGLCSYFEHEVPAGGVVRLVVSSYSSGLGTAQISDETLAMDQNIAECHAPADGRLTPQPEVAALEQ